MRPAVRGHRLNHRLTRAALLGLAVLVAGCAAPSVSPTPPSDPTPSPVEGSPNPAFVEFATHIRDAASVRGQLVRELSEASAGSQDQLRLATGRLAEWAQAEQAWLDEHPADVCYSEAWTAYASGVEDFTTAASDLGALAEASSPPTEAEAQSAAGALGSGSELFEEADAVADSARTACR